jgi:predicted CoA-substrate-specific enzyme activase
MISVGIDCGSTATKMAIYDGSNFRLRIRPTGWSPQQTINSMLEEVSDSEKFLVITGYGRVSALEYDKKVTEITCHGKGSIYLNSSARTIIDIGGQDSKIIKIDEEGNVVDFIMNDKCAAGTGKFLEMSCNLIGKDISELDSFCNAENPSNINAMCAVFAESEIISLLAAGESPGSIAAGVVKSIIKRTITLLGRVDIEDEIFITGGLSKSNVILDGFQRELSKRIYSSKESQFAGAIGAALIGYNYI